MADYAYLNTSRYEVKYTNNQFSHNIRFRFEREQGAAPVGAQLEAISSFFNALTPIFATDFAFNSAAWYNRDTRVSLPAVVPSIEDSPPGINTPGGPSRAYQINFQGKSTGGARATLMLLGVTSTSITSMAQNFRISLAEGGTWLPAALAALNAIPGLVAIDNSTIVWQNYVNVKSHDYWVKAVR